ncbi:SCO family protein [Tenacibaculum pacificus]|uniref:SCO family protein n=1 Tax=Tenacibaculum pacificus TaxID=3018314 RepID=UPI0022F3D89D|nr:SCO family protein [Tenacibaculum pacificus]WBX72568.1 SCO family protein [Tenacibaculum pacificus]
MISFTAYKTKIENEVKIDKETVLPFFNSAEFTPEWISKSSLKYKEIHTIPDFSFINQNGKKVTNKTYKRKIYIANFFFVTCPGICPILEKNMSKIQDKYKNDSSVLLLSHTVMPTKDSVAVLKKYAIDNNIISDKWNLVTGDKKQLYNVARKGYFADDEFNKTKNTAAFIHSENFVLVDKKGRIRGVYNGTLGLETKRLIRHIEILKKED